MPADFAVLVATAWIGMLIGISFIATPVKFRVTSLTCPIALEVGRMTFHVFSRIEWLLAALLLGAEAMANGAAWRWPIAALAAAIVFLQSIWLLPALDRRVAGVISGETLAPSYAHQVYGALEGLKLLALIAAGFAH